MKINRKTYPILENLEKNNLGNMLLFKDDKPFFDLMGSTIGQCWRICNEDFKSEVNIISEPFNEASLKAQKKLIELYQDILKNDLSDFDVNGTYILGDFVFLIKYKEIKGSQNREMFFSFFDKQATPIALYFNSSKLDVNLIWVSERYDIPKNEEMMSKYVSGWIAHIIVLKMFKSYAEVDTKILAGKSKIKGKGYKHLNETNLKICFLDSKWFTNLVKSDAFSVSGHFRLQPKKKEGSWTKELIWIDEFLKNGYTSKARILTNT